MNMFEALRLEKVAEDTVFETQSLNRLPETPILPGNYLPATAGGLGAALLTRRLMRALGGDKGLSLRSPSTYLTLGAGLYTGRRIKRRLDAAEQRAQNDG